MIVADLARSLGNRLAGALELPVEAAERAAYAIEILILDILTVATIASAASLTGLFEPTLAATFTAVCMRLLSGGAHSESPWVCIVGSSGLAVFFGLLGRIMLPYTTKPSIYICVGITSIIGLVILLQYAPADTPAKPIPQKQAKVLKYLSLVLLALWGVVISFVPMDYDLRIASIGGLSWQLLSITPFGYELYYTFDRVFGVKTERR